MVKVSCLISLVEPVGEKTALLLEMLQPVPFVQPESLANIPFTATSFPYALLIAETVVI